MEGTEGLVSRANVLVSWNCSVSVGSESNGKKPMVTESQTVHSYRQRSSWHWLQRMGKSAQETLSEQARQELKESV